MKALELNWATIGFVLRRDIRQDPRPFSQTIPIRIERRHGVIVALLESGQELKQRIGEASAYIRLNRLALSSQCGFASTWEGNLLAVADEEAKLRLVAQTARTVWG